MYRGPVARAEIDYVRGVNCSFILRNLQIRGLVEKIKNPKNSRAYVYQVTPDLLKHLGITSVSELPKYNEMKDELNKLEARDKEEGEIKK